jgi:hypothetical protein
MRRITQGLRFPMPTTHEIVGGIHRIVTSTTLGPGGTSVILTLGKFAKGKPLTLMASELTGGNGQPTTSFVTGLGHRGFWSAPEGSGADACPLPDRRLRRHHRLGLRPHGAGRSRHPGEHPPAAESKAGR